MIGMYRIFCGVPRTPGGIPGPWYCGSRELSGRPVSWGRVRLQQYTIITYLGTECGLI